MKKHAVKLFLFVLAIFVGLSLFESALLYNLLQLNDWSHLLVVLVAGILYTSFLTIPIAIAVFLKALEFTDPLTVILLGGFGGMLGDLIIIRVFRILFKEYSAIRHKPKFNFLRRSLVRYRLNSIAFILGILIIASPLPDELGLLLLGVSKLSYPMLIVSTLIANTIGVFFFLLPILLLE